MVRTLSCGSSAGNFIIKCDGSGCINEPGSNPNNQSFANQLRADREANGCGEPIDSDPVEELLDPPTQ